MKEDNEPTSFTPDQIYLDFRSPVVFRSSNFLSGGIRCMDVDKRREQLSVAFRDDEIVPAAISNFLALINLLKLLNGQPACDLC